ncbi:MAG: hypothetical protein UZ22_OP11002000970 [Microgenomates bacterium OLB23]|nr:MAG: hypothetical protein UZ22_OP11002000970 [Microgenomates bacterium OLB23]
MPHSPLHSQPILKKYRNTRYLGAFSVYPKVRFESQDEDEHIILLLRAHPITFIPWIVTAVGAFILPLILNLVLPNFISVSQLFF